MASSLDFVKYVASQISGAGEITYRKMFGEYGVYCGGKLVCLVCDNQCFVKKTEAGAALYPDCPEGRPYEGAKPQFLMDRIDDSEFMTRFITATCAELPEPKPKKKK